MLSSGLQCFAKCGVPEYTWSDNGPEFIAEAVQKWLHDLHVKPLFIEPGPIFEENGCIESFNSRLRDDLLNGEIFETLLKAKVIIEDWRKDYNGFRPHSSLGYRPPAPEAFEAPKSLAAAQVATEQARASRCGAGADGVLRAGGGTLPSEY